ncbi:MAG: tRNA1(Val) (adenine(37)-N6)-methyltransferase [Dongiaceae bacterium]
MSSPGAATAITDDALLNGRVRLLQPRDGYRAAIDPVFLAASIPVVPGDLVLDIGAGVGAAALCLAWREPRCQIRGIEMQRDLARLAAQNIELNGHVGRVEIMVGDLLRPPPRLAPGSFNHVMANPPFYPSAETAQSANAGRAAAHQEGEAGLADWVRFAVNMARPKGSITFVYRADRIEALLGELRNRAGEIVVFPLWPGGSKPASRILVRARKDAGGLTRLCAGLLLHEADGRYTPAADQILREGIGLML